MAIVWWLLLHLHCSFWLNILKIWGLAPPLLQHETSFPLMASLLWIVHSSVHPTARKTKVSSFFSVTFVWVSNRFVRVYSTDCGLHKGLILHSLGAILFLHPLLFEADHKEMLRQLRFFSLEKRKLQGHLTEASQYLKGANNQDGDWLFYMDKW